IDWQCELARSTNDPSPRRVVAQLAAGNSESRLTLAALPGKEPLQLAIAVDGFPRAFLFQISASQTPGEVEEETARLAVRILDPLDGAELRCPLDSVKARVEIDAPPGGMPELGGFWEIGIDRDRDRELEEDLRLRFPTDRRIRTYVSGFTDDGRVVLDARAGDFTVSLPLTGLCNERPQLIAHAVLPDRETWSSPVELVLDGEGPRIKRVVVGLSQRTIVGPELEITTQATDGEQTGVARVEVAFDMAGTGEFVKEPPPVAAARGEDGRWKASLPTAELKPGQYVVLLRAIDRVGNAGPISRQPLLLETQADLDRDRAAQRTILRGRVEYFGTPVPEVDVVLIPIPEAAAGTAAASDSTKGGATAGKSGAGSAGVGEPGRGPVKGPLSAQTDAEGRFLIKQVPFGKYTMKANGVFRNKRRATSREILVDETTNGQAGLLELP
ncbi:MAG: hypothetical protein NT069_13415, partial [Planctomycetota bacterium]|nr:hypothetical protein [Planctomycetota bacterium]